VPIDSKAGNEQASVCKVQIKGVTMATSHITCHQEAVEGAKPKAKAAKLCKALDHKSKTRAAKLQLRTPMAIIRQPTTDLPVNSDH